MTERGRDFYSKFFYDRNYHNSTILKTSPTKATASNKRKVNRSAKSRPPFLSGLTPELLSHSIPDPTLETLTHGTCLIVGRSCTGKSSLLRTLVGRWQGKSSRLYLVNVRPDEVAEYKKLTSRAVECLNLEQLKSVKKNSVILIEDIISLKEREQTALREALNYVAHHKRCKVYCVTHGIFKTGLFTASTLFNFLIFTNSPSNIPVVRQALDRFAIEKESISTCLKNMTHFSNSLGRARPDSIRRIYYFWDTTRMRFGMTENAFLPGTLSYIDGLGGQAAAASQKKTGCKKSRSEEAAASATSSSQATTADRAKKYFERFFVGASERRRAGALFEMLMSNPTARRATDLANLTLKFRTGPRRERSVESVSLVDYIHVLLAPDARVTPKLQAVHNFVTSVCQLPRSCIVNNTWTKK